MRSGTTTGKVESIQKKRVIIQVGQLKMTVNLRDLVPSGEPLDVRTQKGVLTEMVDPVSGFEDKLDIRGMRREDAIKITETFIDKALISNASFLRIVHGKGNGILREAVKNKLREYTAVIEIGHPEEENGGNGVTYVKLG